MRKKHMCGVGAGPTWHALDLYLWLPIGGPNAQARCIICVAWGLTFGGPNVM